MSQLTEAWEMSNQVNLFLLDSLAKEHLAARYDARTRSVAAQFAHMHNVRLRWLRHAAPELVGKVEALPKDARLTKARLKKALQASAGPIARFLGESEKAGKVKSWKGPPATFLGYMIAHEAHHRGLAMVAMRAAGHKLPQEVVYGQWDWGKRSHRRSS